MERLSQDELAYFRERGFDLIENAVTTVSREVNGQRQSLTQVSSNPRLIDPPWYWAAICTRLYPNPDPDTAMQLVVSSSEQISDVTVAFVTAEVRGWRRQ